MPYTRRARAWAHLIAARQNHCYYRATLGPHAVLSISSAHLPDGVQRRRTYADQLNMRQLYAEGEQHCSTLVPHRIVQRKSMPRVLCHTSSAQLRSAATTVYAIRMHKRSQIQSGHGADTLAALHCTAHSAHNGTDSCAEREAMDALVRLANNAAQQQAPRVGPVVPDRTCQDRLSGA